MLHNNQVARRAVQQGLLPKAENGEEVLARIPNPNLGCSRHVFASDVATLDFADLVGSDYILMKRVQGRQLSEAWPTMSESQRFGFVKRLVAIKAKPANINVLNFGSLYFRGTFSDSLPALGRPADTIGRYVLGQATDRLYWIDGREGMSLDRGPWKTAEEYFSAIAKREITCIQTPALGEPTFGTLAFQNSDAVREAHIELLEKFLVVLSHILPPRELSRPVLLHQDLHLDNILLTTRTRQRYLE
ncbi:hypothetical protein AJ80_03700 [Polytolypa hystricis UAMH7299]|uniref:Aminoglycoside phosphotransferase domain-containing protein n=1 Tax=Polytolypa hystricis (strain UAMH7299) TaxID=1447883 RepID=A0A2B7YFT4_POLH7|nr:hypothetical protein AJ80_03700 [Polytolypa hystricis UAMH7299]